MNLDSKYDEFNISSAKNIKNDGKYDQFNIREVESVVIDSKNSTIKIGMLHRKCYVDTKYGTVHIKSTGPDMQEIDIESKYTDYKFGIDTDFQLKYIGDHSDLSINVPHEKHKGNDPQKIKAYRGNEKAYLKIKAYLKYGSLQINNNQRF